MKKNIITILLFLVVLAGMAYYFNYKTIERKIVYADTIKLFNAYHFKTDMEKSSQTALSKLKNELDSAEVMYKVNSSDPVMQNLYMEKQQRWSEGYNAINKEINEKVWERLNPLINKFGKEEGFELMIGANGMGTVLYASEVRDVTDDLIRYVNTNYEKGN